MKSLWYILCCLLLLPGVGHAQERYNRWDARPAPNVPTASAEERGAKALASKNRQDSLRRVAAVAKLPLLRRGIGQRLQEGVGTPADAYYYSYLYTLIQYPKEAIEAQTEGIVLVRVTVNAAGQVVRTGVVETTISADAPGRTAMTQQALSMFHLLRFEPSESQTEEILRVRYKY